jgi:FAD:protein FMN transferase
MTALASHPWRNWIIGAGLVAAVAAVAWLASQRPPALQRRTRFLLDTYCTLQAQGGPEILASLDRVLDEIAKLDVKFNAINPASPIYAFNHRDEPITDPEIVGVVQQALEVGRASAGALDITIYPVVELWGFYGETPRRPSSQDLNRERAKVDYRQLKVEAGRVTKSHPKVRLDLGAVAKGYAVKRAVELLRAEGIRSALVDFGGDVFALGRLGRRTWKVGVQDPRGTGVIGVLILTDSSVATSGDYERFFEQDGVRYHHLLDPATGEPARGLRSVTVLTPDAVLADAWSTAFFVRGPEWTAAYCEQHPELQALWVDAAGAVKASRGMRLRFKPVKGR